MRSRSRRHPETISHGQALEATGKTFLFLLFGEEEWGKKSRGGGTTPKGLCTKVGKKIKESGPKVFLRAHSSPSKSGNDIFRQSLSLLSQFFLPKFAGVREHEFKGVGETKEERRVDALSPLSHLALVAPCAAFHRKERRKCISRKTL